MMSDTDMAAKADKVLGLLYEKFGLRARDLRHGVKRAGRRLPRGVRRQAQRLGAAQALARNPRLARQIDAAAVERDYRGVVAYLRGIDVADRRRARILGLAGALAANLIAVAVLFLLWLWWRGYV